MKRNNLLINNETKSRVCKRKLLRQITLFEEMYKCNIESLSISFINDEDMIELNNKHLHHEGSTDIITFTYEADLQKLDGEILICVEEAKRQARVYKVKLLSELNRLVFHGLLHLAGYKDKTKKEKELIHKYEDDLLESFNERENK